MKTETTHAAFYAMLHRMQGTTKEDIVSQYAPGGSMSLSDLYNNNRKHYNEMLSDMRRAVVVPAPQAAKVKTPEQMDKARKQAIAAITAFFKTKGLYQSENYSTRLAKAKSVAERATGGEFNKLTYAELRRVTGEFNAQVRTANAVGCIAGIYTIKLN